MHKLKKEKEGDSLNNDKEMQEIAMRIENRRKELELSYQDLATLTGLNKSTLQRYTAGTIKNIPLSKIVPLSKALKTSPEYLMGWDNPKEAANDFDEALLNMFKKVPQGQKETVLRMIKAIADSSD